MTDQIPPELGGPTMLQYATPQVQPGLRRIGIAQRRIMWIILAAILMTISLVAMSATGGAAAMGVMILLLLFRIAVIVLMMVGIYQLAAALGYGVTGCVLLVIGMLIPLVSLIILLTINQQATNRLKKAGIKVGLMGAKIADLPVA